VDATGYCLRKKIIVPAILQQSWERASARRGGNGDRKAERRVWEKVSICGGKNRRRGVERLQQNTWGKRSKSLMGKLRLSKRRKGSEGLP